MATTRTSWEKADAEWGRIWLVDSCLTEVLAGDNRVVWERDVLLARCTAAKVFLEAGDAGSALAALRKALAIVEAKTHD